MLSKTEISCSLDSTTSSQSSWLIATTNTGKVSEIRAFLQQQNLESYVQIFSLKDFPNIPDVEETGKTFLDNALIKAKAYFHHTGIPVLSDDSGLVVPSLNGNPGVYSARYAGENASASENNDKLLLEMQSDKNRDAFFVCNLVFLLNPSLYIVSEGYCHGEIADSPKGENGFGYDPIFYLPTYKKTMAEIPFAQKQEISHRGQALRQIMPILRGLIYGNI